MTDFNTEKDIDDLIAGRMSQKEYLLRNPIQLWPGIIFIIVCGPQILWQLLIHKLKGNKYE